MRKAGISARNLLVPKLPPGLDDKQAEVINQARAGLRKVVLTWQMDEWFTLDERQAVFVLLDALARVEREGKLPHG